PYGNTWAPTCNLAPLITRKRMDKRSSTGRCPFLVVYGRNPFTPLDLAPLPAVDSYSVEGEAQATQIKALHEQGDFVWIYLRKDRFPLGRYGKLQDRADGPFRVLKRINDNAYKIDLPGSYRVSATFNVTDLAPYVDTDDFHGDSGTSRLLKGEDDTDVPDGSSPVDQRAIDENEAVMAISIISVSSDSSEDSVGTPAGRVILFGTIPTTIPDTTPVITPPTTQTDTTVIPTETPIITPTIPPSPDYTPASPDYSPASDIDYTPDTPPSPTHGTPFTEITSSTQRSPIIPRRRVMILAPGQPILHGRPYRYHPNGPVHMMTARKRVGPLPVQQLAVRHSVDHSSPDSSSRHSLLDHSSPDLLSTSVAPSRNRRRSPMTSVHILPLVSRALSPVHADLIPSPKRVRDIGYLADVEGHRIVGVESAVTALTERVAELERDNRRLRGTASIESQRVDRLQRGMSLSRIEAIRPFLVYASIKDFVVYQMDVKSVFLYGKIKEEVYVCQPLGFEDPDFPDKFYKVKKALYGLYQAPRAWYETLSTYLLDNGFQRGKIDKTLFIRRHKGNIILVQVYADDIIFGSTKKELCTSFKKLMHGKFQMSSMGELTFFLGLQVKKKQDGIFISQDKYVAEILKKYGFSEVKTASIPIETQKPLLKDKDGEEVDVHIYRSMIGSLMYLTSLMPDIMFACKKQTVVANSTNEAEYAATSSYCD
nr:copia protein [Tanacetum cinerariifolium]